MSNIYNIYCDESCHLENDHQKAMVLGAIWCPKDKVTEISKRIIEIKVRNNKSSAFEPKWTKITNQNLQLYFDLVNYFFDDDDLHFRGIVADKTILDHHSQSQTHDEWYYKMYFRLLKFLLDPKACYNVYLDIKDTLGKLKVVKLKDYLCNSIYDFNRKIIQNVQQVKSNQVTLVQITDILIGALSYKARNLPLQSAKGKLVEHIQSKSGYTLLRSTLYKESKFNVFFWDGKKNV